MKGKNALLQARFSGWLGLQKEWNLAVHSNNFARNARTAAQVLIKLWQIACQAVDTKKKNVV